ncbi:S8 family serine peptidase [Nonomuraea sp. GTA35]|uniref:S8 family serine peptidase n=1 Tax=Nonomuraea sp. GTA35 TaxID=1676746 RepID=UPI0035C0C87F
MALPRPPLARRAGVLLTAVTMLATGLAAVPASATSAPPATPAPTAASPAEQAVPLSGVRAAKVVVTLITGDKVQLTRAATGKYRVEPAPGTRQGGGRINLFTQFTPDGVFVLPDDAVAAVQAGLLDKRLFDVKYLAENGYADDATKKLPVIVQYPEGQPEASLRRSAANVPAGDPTRTLESIDASALDIAKAEAGTFWEAVRAEQAAGQGLARTPGALGSGIAKIWLDAKVKADLDVSVPMIGAPAAWESGYDGTGVKVAVLDTGADLGHPDLSGKVADSKSFVPDQPVQDGHGHGTHVASTIAGSGAASGGKHKGVAPGAQLVVGKVLDDAGSGMESWIIEGMEWAARSGSKTVSMSLGSSVPSDGTDPLSQAVNDLTAETGTLFVIAAGNLHNKESISAPGAAEAALTVAAVDKNDQLAGFSSRGPRVDDGALKPDIAAPGVDIVAARSAGTSMGAPVNEHYTGASGTSMATPHVAGAVAIMAQQHPDWTAQQLKAALMSTAKDDGFTVYEQGAGRVDLERATRQRVFAAGGPTGGRVDFGLLDESGTPRTGQVSYVNLGDQPVTLALKAAMSGGAKVAVADATLTVPAGGTAGTTVTLDPAGLPLGTYSGSVTAEADGVRLTTPVGAVRDVTKYDLTIRTLDRDGKPRTPTAMSVVDVEGAKGELGPYHVQEDGVVVTRVPEGTVSVLQVLDWVDGDDRANRGWLFEPELTITGDTELVLDTRKATEIRFTAPKTAQPLNNYYDLFFQRTLPDGQVFGGTLLNGSPIGAWEKVWALPTEKVTKGAFRLTGQWELGVPEVTMTMRTPRRTTLHPVSRVHLIDRVELHAGHVPFEGTKDLRVVDGGKGLPEDLAGKDLRGALVLIDAEPAQGVFGTACGLQVERVGPIRDAGAAGILAFNDRQAVCPIPLAITQKPFSGPLLPVGIPVAYISHAEGMKVREAAGRAPVTIRVEGTPNTPYSYVFKPYADGRVPDSMHYRVTERQLHRVDLEVHAGPYTRYMNWRSTWRTDDVSYTSTSTNALHWSYPLPNRRSQWVWPLDSRLVSQAGMSALVTADPAEEVEETRYRTDVFDRPGRTAQQWFATPSTPGAATASDKVYRLGDPDAKPLEQLYLGIPCAICVHDGNLWVTPSMVSGVGERRDDGVVFGDIQPRYELHLYRDGKELPNAPVEPFATLPRYPLPEGAATYRLTAKNDLQDLEWTFTAPPGKEQVRPGVNCYAWWIDGPVEQCRTVPAVYVSHDLGGTLSIDNTVAAGRRHTFQIEAYHGPSAGKMPAIAGVRLWTSTDDGATWQQADLRRGRDGIYTATAEYPHYRATKGAVSLKAEAWDAAGNRVKQTTLRAFNLR